MTAYRAESGMNLPVDGDRFIRHLVEIFTNDDIGDLQTDINLFLETLRLLPTQTPYIERIQFDTHYETAMGPSSVFGALVHYRLVGPPP